MTVTHVDAGVARNVVPDRCTLAVNVRVAPGRSLDDARREVETLAGPEGEVRWLDESPSARPRSARRSCSDFLAATGAPVLPKQAWTDVATLIHAGIPAVNYGPGESSQAHQPEEWVSIETMERVEDHARALPGGRRRVTLRLEKWQGAGNAYLLVERSALGGELRPDAATLLCDVRTGVGADGVLVLEPDGTRVGMAIVNPDGSASEACGNGTRMVARWLGRADRRRRRDGRDGRRRPALHASTPTAR